MLISEMWFLPFTQNCLARAGINKLDQLSHLSSEAIARIPKMGRKTYSEIARGLRDLGVLHPTWEQLQSRLRPNAISSAKITRWSLPADTDAGDAILWSKLRKDPDGMLISEMLLTTRAKSCLAKSGIETLE